jgi:hypothetical protein
MGKLSSSTSRSKSQVEFFSTRMKDLFGKDRRRDMRRSRAFALLGTVALLASSISVAAYEEGQPSVGASSNSVTTGVIQLNFLYVHGVKNDGASRINAANSLADLKNSTESSKTLQPRHIIVSNEAQSGSNATTPADTNVAPICPKAQIKIAFTITLRRFIHYSHSSQALEPSLHTTAIKLYTLCHRLNTKDDKCNTVI